MSVLSKPHKTDWEQSVVFMGSTQLLPTGDNGTNAGQDKSQRAVRSFQLCKDS